MFYEKGWTQWREILQKKEFSSISSLISKPKAKILEIGGGDGRKSLYFKNLGYDVVCTDTHPRENQFYPVIRCDENKFPFESKYFDVIFSANVLQEIHREHTEILFKELNLILKDDGIIIHSVPSSWWSIYTNFWHYFLIPFFIKKSIYKKFKKKAIQNPETIPNPNTLLSSNTFNLRNLFLHPLGPNPSFLHEIFYFRKSSWANLFTRYYEIVEIKNEPFIFSAYGVMKNKFFKIRNTFGKLFPTRYYFKLKKKT